MATICSEHSRSVFDAHPAHPAHSVHPAHLAHPAHPVHPDHSNTLKAGSESPLRWLSAYGHRFLQWVERRREQRESRDAFAHLLKLDESLLQDIGVTRADVERAAKLPLAEDAAQVLYQATGRYRSNRV